MSLGDGSTWDETNPTDATQAVQIDDYNRDLRVGTRGRMAREHEWPSSQSATSEAGAHKFMTLQAQAVKPTVAGTQIAAIYADTLNNFCFEKSDGTVVTIVSGTGVGDGKILASGTDTVSNYISSKIGDGLSISGTNVIVPITVIDYGVGVTTGTAKAVSNLKFVYGGTVVGGGSSQLISGLPFTDLTSYRVNACYASSTAVNENPLVQQANGASFTIYNNQASRLINWIAVGV